MSELEQMIFDQATALNQHFILGLEAGRREAEPLRQALAAIIVAHDRDPEAVLLSVLLAAIENAKAVLK